MDIFDLDLTGAAEDGAELIVKHPISGEDFTYLAEDGTLKPVKIVLKGNDSKAFRDRIDYFSRKSGRNDKKVYTIAEIEDRSSDLLAAVTVSWEGITWPIDGVKQNLPCTRENAKMLYKERPWLRHQVDEFVSETENFFKNNSSN